MKHSGRLMKKYKLIAATASRHIIATFISISDLRFSVENEQQEQIQIIIKHGVI
jgi:hypothetical protein